MILINRQVNNHYSMGGTHFLQTGYLLLNRNAPLLSLSDKITCSPSPISSNDHITHTKTIFLQDDHCLSRSSVSQTLWNTMLPCIFYIGMLILLLYYPAHSLRVTVSIKKEASSLFTHCWLLIILLILFTSLRLRQFFYF